MIVDWLLETFPLGPPVSTAEHETFAAQAYAKQWCLADIEAAMVLWSLVTEHDETDKPAA